MFGLYLLLVNRDDIKRCVYVHICIYSSFRNLLFSKLAFLFRHKQYLDSTRKKRYASVAGKKFKGWP